MPVQRGTDARGPFYRWGETGKAYHFMAGSPTSRRMARQKAERQGAAIERRVGLRLVTVPPSLREPLGAERITVRRLRDLAAWFERRPTEEHGRRGGARVRAWVLRALGEADPEAAIRFLESTS